MSQAQWVNCETQYLEKYCERTVTMNNLERFCLYNEMQSDSKIHDKYTVKPNILFDTII